MKVEFRVLTAFKATAFAIAGQEHLFEPGDLVLYEVRQNDELVIIEANNIAYIVERSVFAISCISNTFLRDT